MVQTLSSNVTRALLILNYIESLCDDFQLCSISAIILLPLMHVAENYALFSMDPERHDSVAHNDYFQYWLKPTM